MSASDATKVVAAVAPAVAPAAIPVWGPEAVRLVGVNVPIASMILSLLGLWMARAVSSAREGEGAGDWRLTCLLAVMLIGLVIDRQPTAGIAVAWGVGIGSSGILIVDLVKDWVLDKVRRLRSNTANDMADLLKGMNDDDDRR